MFSMYCSSPRLRSLMVSIATMQARSLGGSCLVLIFAMARRALSATAVESAVELASFAHPSFPP